MKTLDKRFLHFKEFSLRHDACAMKVGTDGVLLGAWADVSAGQALLDIGAGSGLIALMAAQRTSCSVRIDAVEIDTAAADQASLNFQASPWHDRVNVYQTSIQNFYPTVLYDTIISNPPFFAKSFSSTDKARAIARQTETLRHADLLDAVVRLLKPTGIFYVILPYSEGLAFIEEAAEKKLFCHRKVSVRSKATKPIERLLLAFSNNIKERDDDDIVLHNKDGKITEEYRRLTAAFYHNY